MPRFSPKELLLRASIIVSLAAVPTLHAQVTPRSNEATAMQLLRRALHYGDLYNWAAAGPYFRKAEKIFVAAGDQRNALYARLGGLRSRAERLNLPKTSHQLAQELDTSQLLRTDKQLRMFCLIVKGDIDGEMNSAAMRDDWAQVEALAKLLGNSKWQYRALAQLGLAAFYDGNLPAARTDVGTALAQATKARDSGAEIRYLTVLGIGLVESKMYNQALPYFTHALEIARATPDSGYPFVTQQARLQALIGLGQLDAAQRLDTEYLAQAKKYRQPGQEAVALILASTIAEARNQDTEALSALKKALAISKPAGYLRQVAQEQTQLAEIYHKHGNLKEAERYAKLAAAATQTSGDIWSVPERLRTLAEIKTAEGDYAEAGRIYERAEAFIDSSVAGVSGVLDKTAFIKASSLLYTEHFSIMAQHFNDPAKAFSIIEQVRGRVESDLLIAGSRAPKEAEQNERQLSALRLKLMSARSNAEVRAIRNQIFMAEQARWVTPDLSILKARSHEILSLKQVQSGLNASTLLLEYVAAKPRSYCLVISRKRARIVPLAGENEISPVVTTYRKAVAAKQAGRAESSKLYHILLQPIPEFQQKKILVIVRDGPLYFLPFDSLMDSQGRYVVQSHTVVYAPSATAYTLLSRQRRNPSDFRHRLLAVGGVPYTPTELKRVSLAAGFEADDTSTIPGSKKEVRAAATAIHGPSDTLLIGSEATKYSFEHEDLAQYRLIHLAVHGFADPQHPTHSALVLLNDPSAHEDGLLDASEIVQLRLKADLVVLSACDTAVGPVEGEEGISTLARSFLLAGAKSVISTLWPIEDVYSYALMKFFYTHLAAGDPAPFALAEAKRDMLQMWGPRAVPYYWAGYIYEGPVR
jgi:CHAT domain-containing protein